MHFRPIIKVCDMYNWSRTLVNRHHTLADQWYFGETTGYHLDRYIEEGNIQNKTQLGANYSLNCVNKTSGELTFGWGKSTFFGGETFWSSGETTLSWGETTLCWSVTTWGETDLWQNDLFPTAALASHRSAHFFGFFLISRRVSSR